MVLLISKNWEPMRFLQSLWRFAVRALQQKKFLFINILLNSQIIGSFFCRCLLLMLLMGGNMLEIFFLSKNLWFFLWELHRLKKHSDVVRKFITISGRLLKKNTA